MRARFYRFSCHQSLSQKHQARFAGDIVGLWNCPRSKLCQFQLPTSDWWKWSCSSVSFHVFYTLTIWLWMHKPGWSGDASKIYLWKSPNLSWKWLTLIKIFYLPNLPSSYYLEKMVDVDLLCTIVINKNCKK